MTTITIDSKFEHGLMDTFVALFAKVIRKDASSESAWAKFSKSIKSHGLTTFCCESTFKPAALEVDNSRLEDSRYRRTVIRKLKAPRPSATVSHEVRIDRERILVDDHYLADMSKLIAYKWMRKLADVETDLERLLLLKTGEKALRRALDSLGMHESDGETVAGIVMRSFAEEALDSNETLKRVEAEIRAEGARSLHDFRESMAPVTERILSEFSSNIDAHLAKVSAEADEFIAGMRARMSEVAASNEKGLAECSHDDEETEWRKLLAASDARRREARRKMGWLEWIFS